MTATTTKQIVPQKQNEQDALYQSGYRAFVRDGSLLVRKPDGHTYMVNPYQGTCSCPARGNCKHKTGLVSLVFLSMDELSGRRKWAAYDALCDYWFAYTMWVTQERLQDDMPEWNEQGHIAFGHPAQEVL